MKKTYLLCVVILLSMWGRFAFAADMQSYHKHIAKYRELLAKAEQLQAKGDIQGANKMRTNAQKEKDLADVALNAPSRLSRFNEPAPLYFYDRPYWGYWYGPYRWWGYPYRRW